MSSYNSCATYTLLQSSFRYAKPQLPLGSFNHQNFNHSSNYTTGQSAVPSPISKSFPPTTSSNNDNNHTFNWHYPVKTDGTIARRNCMRESLNRHGTTCYPEIRSTIGRFNHIKANVSAPDFQNIVLSSKPHLCSSIDFLSFAFILIYNKGKFSAKTIP